jgi:hypothetical protein
MGMVRDTALVSTWSWGPFVGYCTPAWFPCVDDERLHARGPTWHSSSMPNRVSFRMPWQRCYG